MRDPAFLFYYQDFLFGTRYMSLPALGAYIRCLCEQADVGFVDKAHMKIICESSDAIMSEVCKKFVKDKEGNFFNERLKIEMEKRRKYAESRRNNRLGNKKTKKTNKKDIKNMSVTYDSHMGNVNENVNEDININKKGVEFEEFLNFAKTKEIYRPELDYSIKEKYEQWKQAGWKDGNGKKIKNWKTKLGNTLPYLKPTFTKKQNEW